MHKVPHDQVELTEEQKQAQSTKVITAVNPNAAKNITRYNFKTGEFKVEGGADNLHVHFSMDGNLILVDGEEYKEQKEMFPDREKAEPVAVANAATSTKEDGAEEGAEPEEAGAAEEGGVLKNQFNFSDRATQTFNNPLRDREVATEPPPTAEFSENVTHWEISDTYLEDVEKAAALRNVSNKKHGQNKSAEDEGEIKPLESASTATTDVTSTDRFRTAVKVMERLVNQNAELDLFMDFKYHEDKDGESASKEGKGTFLPLWTFQYKDAKKKTVTALSWNPYYNDLFAVGYGSYDFVKQGPGLICIFSLKNSAYPEYIFNTESGVMSLDWHPQRPGLLACGLYDGTVCVYDVRVKTSLPVYSSNNPKTKHTDPVWEIRWQKEEAGKSPNFFSVSSDGRVTNWITNKSELINEDLVELKLQPAPSENSPQGDEKKDEDAELVGLGGGCCFDFNKSNPHLFVVGTEEGAIHLYSKAYNSQWLQTYEGHHMSTYSLRWNSFHPGVFLSASADWTVKLWEYNTPSPLMTFDLNTSAGDVAWAPFSSTVFAIITTDGRLRLYDLNVNKHEPVGETRLNKKARLTKVCFNPREPILIVGDDKGVVSTLKLSSSIRKSGGPRVEDMDVGEEVKKLDKLLIFPEHRKPNEALAMLNAAKQQLLDVKSEAPAAEAKVAEAPAAEE